MIIVFMCWLVISYISRDGGGHVLVAYANPHGYVLFFLFFSRHLTLPLLTNYCAKLSLMLKGVSPKLLE